MSHLVYAIDYGTSNTLLAAASREDVHGPIPLDGGASDPTVLKSILYAPPEGAWTWGQSAIQAYMEHLGEGRLLRSMKKYLPEKSFEGTTLQGRYLNLTDIIGAFLRTLRERANAHFGQDVQSVVLGRPAVFSHDPEEDALAEKRLTTAAQLAGFRDVRFCPEPVAAAYAFRHQLSSEKTVLIADFGGGTSDFTVLRMGPQAFREKDVLATFGTPIAGDRFDGVLMRDIISPHFGSQITYRLPMGSVDLHLPKQLLGRLCSAPDIAFLSRKDIMRLLKDAQRWSLCPEDSQRMERLFVLIEEHLGYKLFKEIEKTKINLSQEDKALFEFDHPGLTLKEEVEGEKFHLAADELVQRIMDSLDETMRRAGVVPSEVDIVCCTGGTARLPQLSASLKARFGGEKLQQYRNFHSVVGGLAEHAQLLAAE